MDASTWLTQAVDRALFVRDPARLPELVGAAEAFSACGLITRQAAADAERRLYAAFAPGALDSSFALPDTPSAIRRGAPSEERLLAGHCSIVSLARVEEVHIMLVAVERWSNSVIVRLASAGEIDPAPATDAESHATVWWTAGSDAESRAPKRLLGPPGLSLLRLPLELTDDRGTTYVRTSGQASGEAPWRAEICFRRGIPPEATQIRLALAWPDTEPDALTLDLDSDTWVSP